MNLSQRLDKRILLQVQSEVQDQAGQPIQQWSNVVTAGDGKVWAEIKDISGREFVAGGATQNEVTTTITIRSRGGILAKMRAVYGSEIYYIEAVLERAGRTLALMCSKGMP